MTNIRNLFYPTILLLLFLLWIIIRKAINFIPLKTNVIIINFHNIHSIQSPLKPNTNNYFDFLHFLTL